MTEQSIYKCSALFDRIIQGYFSHLDMLWRTVSQVGENGQGGRAVSDT